MIARSVQGNPLFFQEINHYLATGEKLAPPSIAEWKRVIFRYADLLIALKGEWIAISEMRKNLVFYFKGKPNATDYKAQATRIESRIDLDNVVNDYIEYYNNSYNMSK